jgi:hypothetical protein
MAIWYLVLLIAGGQAAENADLQQNLNEVLKGLVSSLGRDTLKRNACERNATKLVQESSKIISSVSALFSSGFSDSAVLSDAWSVTEAVKDTTDSCNLLSLYARLDQLAKMDKKELKSKLIHLTPDFVKLVEMAKSDQFDAYEFGKILGRFLMRQVNWTLETSQPVYTELFSTKPLNLFIIIAELIDEPALKKSVPLLIKLNDIFVSLALISAGDVMIPYRILVLVKDIQALNEILKELSEELDWFKTSFEPALTKLDEFCTEITSSDNWSWLNSAYQTSIDKLDEVSAAATSIEDWSWINSAYEASVDKVSKVGTAATSIENWSWLNSAYKASVDKVSEVGTAGK